MILVSNNKQQMMALIGLRKNMSIIILLVNKDFILSFISTTSLRGVSIKGL